MRYCLIASWISISVLLLTACASSTPAPATSAPTAVPPTTAPSPTEFAAGVPDFPKLGSIAFAGDEVPAGRFKSPAKFSIPFVFETSKVYRGVTEDFPNAHIFGLVQGNPALPPRMFLFWAVDPRYTPDQVISELRTTKDVAGADSQPAKSMKLGDISGTQFDVVSNYTVFLPPLSDFVGHTGDYWQTNSSHVHLRFMAFSISGQTLLVYIEAPPEEFDSFAPDAEQILGTVKFEVE